VLAVLPSGPGHVFIAWAHDSAGTRGVRLQRIALTDGSVAGGWPVAGLQVFAGLTTSGRVKVIGDGADGALVAAGVDRAVRIQSDGTPAPGWPAAGRSLVDAAALPTSTSGYAVAATATGFLVGWGDSRPPSANRVRWLLPDGSADPAEPDAGRIVEPSPPFTTPLTHAIVSDGQGGALIGWEHHKCCQDFSPLKVGWVAASSLVDVPARNALRVALETPVPNPARGEVLVRFSLPSDAPARLELLDVSGRRVRSVSVQGAGAHAFRFDELERLTAGVYVLRLEQGGRAATSKVALAH
jgi:hypothetical protein